MSEDSGREGLRHNVVQALQRVFTNAPLAGPWFQLELTMKQLKVLLILRGSSETGLTMTGLADRLGVTTSTVTGIVDRLVDQGYVTRGEDPADRRVVVARLAPRGIQMLASLYGVSVDFLSLCLEKLNDDDLRVVARAFGMIGQAAEQLTEGQLSAGHKLSSDAFRSED